MMNQCDDIFSAQLFIKGYSIQFCKSFGHTCIFDRSLYSYILQGLAHMKSHYFLSIWADRNTYILGLCFATDIFNFNVYMHVTTKKKWWNY